MIDVYTFYEILYLPYLCTCTSLQLDDMARIFFSTLTHKCTQFVMSGSILFLPPYTRGEKKNIWPELELNPGPLASQATALTTRPLLLGLLITFWLNTFKLFKWAQYRGFVDAFQVKWSSAKAEQAGLRCVVLLRPHVLRFSKAYLIFLL